MGAGRTVRTLKRRIAFTIADLSDIGARSGGADRSVREAAGRNE
jgi:hypothetical protein